MAIEPLVRGLCEEQMFHIAERVEQEFKAEVGKHNRTGEAQASISILERSPSHALIGGRNAHLYWLDQGNDRKGKRIYPKHANALYVKDYGVYRASVSAYEGFGIARKVADKFR